MTAEKQSMPPLASLYQELILEHYRRPRNRGTLPDANRVAHVQNPTCGDDIRLQLRMEGDRIEEVRFTGEGCSISQASASMMTQQIRGRSSEEVVRLATKFRSLMHGDPASRELGELRALAGVARYPVRIKCALLGWEALARAIEAGDPARG